jgi:predicted metal-dependent peptidase
VGDIVIVVDTSGSIGTEELEQFAGEINAITKDAQPESVRVVYCDAAVQAVEEFSPSEPIKLSPKAAEEPISCHPSSGWKRTASGQNASST